MNDINTVDKKELEKAFAEDFSSPIFPVLGELYLKNKELNRAKRVCQIGLKHDPENINGYYILAKTHLYNNELIEAEKILKTVIKKNPLHINGLKLLIKVQEELNVSKKIKLNYLNQLLNIFPDDENLKGKISKIDSRYFKKNKTPSDEQIVKDNPPIQKNMSFNIQPNMATLTFVEILKEQKHYYEALHVLSIIESKSGSNKESKKLNSELQKLLDESH